MRLITPYLLLILLFFSYRNSYAQTTLVLNPKDVCINTPAYSLTGGSPIGGTYSGDGVDGMGMGIFDPMVAGTGSHVITYTALDMTTATDIITVHTLPSVTQAAFANQSIDGPPLVLSGGNPLGGVYSGIGVVAGIFYPAVAGLGTRVITYTYTDAWGCSNSFSRPIVVFSLFTGGNADGFSVRKLTQSACPPLATTNIFYGGNSDGFSSSINIQSLCPPLFDENVFYGGNADGFSTSIIIQSLCPPHYDENVFYGGNSDGFSFNNLTQTICPPLLSTNITYGGNADGYSGNIFVQSACPPLPSSNIFFGGNADGHSLGKVNQQICASTLNTNIFYGGNAAGYDRRRHDQQTCFPLPIELLFFRAEPEENYISLNWSTAVEINNDYFTITRSKDGKNFMDLFKINGTGFSNSIQNYSAIDTDPLDGISYYRLRQTDFNGSMSWSDIIAVDLLKNISDVFSLYPNPANSEIFIKSTSLSESQIKINIKNSLNKSMSESELFIPENETILRIPINNLEPGFYFLIIDFQNGNKNSFVFKFIKQ